MIIDKKGPLAKLAAKRGMASCDFIGQCTSSQIQTFTEQLMVGGCTPLSRW